MEPIILETEQFSKDPGDNYLQFLLSFAVAQHTTEIYFYVTRQHIRVFRNSQGGIDISRLERPLRDELSKIFDGLINRTFKGLEPLVIPEGFHEDAPIPIAYLGSLERKLKEIYRLEKLEDITDSLARKDINVSGIKIATSLEKKQERKGYIYHMKISYR